MADSENMIQVQVDVGEIESGLKDLSGGMEELNTAIDKLKEAVSTGVDTIKRSLQDVKTGIENTSTNITKAIEHSTSTLIGSITNVVEKIDEVFAKLQEARAWDGASDAATKGVDWTFELIDLAMNGKTSANDDSKTNLPKRVALPGPTTPLDPSTSGKSATGTGGGDITSSGIMSSAMGDVASLFSYDTEGMIQSLGNLSTKLKESAAAWKEHMAAKLADNGIDLQIIKTNTIEHVKAFGKTIAELAKNTAGWIANTASKVGSTAAEWAMIAATTAWQAICAVATAVTTAFGAAVTFLTSPIGLVIIGITALIAIVVLLVKNWDTVKAAMLSAWDAIVGALGNAWKWFEDTIINPLVNGIKGAINGVIGFINGLISGAVNGINGLINVLNKLQFDIPDWVPVFGGETFGFHLKLLSAPQIPYLAKGAVLPANRPFLAMVGDQRHGTNVEAPLATIQEAVALVLNDQLSAMMAGFEATVAEVRELRRTVNGIQIGDATIGQAAARYQRKMAVVRGGSMN